MLLIAPALITTSEIPGFTAVPSEGNQTPALRRQEKTQRGILAVWRMKGFEFPGALGHTRRLLDLLDQGPGVCVWVYIYIYVYLYAGIYPLQRFTSSLGHQGAAERSRNKRATR